MKATDQYRVTFDGKVPVAAKRLDRCARDGPGAAATDDGQLRVRAHQSCVPRQGRRTPQSPEDAQYFLRWIDHVVGLLQKSDAFDTPAQKQEVLQLWRRARGIYAGMAG